MVPCGAQAGVPGKADIRVIPWLGEAPAWRDMSPQGRYSATVASRASVRVPRQHRRDTKWLSGLSALALSCIRARVPSRARMLSPDALDGAGRAYARQRPATPRCALGATSPRLGLPSRLLGPLRLPRRGAQPPDSAAQNSRGYPLTEPLLTVPFCLTPETCPRPLVMTQRVSCLHAVLRHSLRSERRLRSQHPSLRLGCCTHSRSPPASRPRPRAHVL